MEVEAVDEGILAKILIPEGSQDVAVNEIIAVLTQEGEDASAGSAPAPAAKAPPAAEAAPRRPPPLSPLPPRWPLSRPIPTFPQAPRWSP